MSEANTDNRGPRGEGGGQGQRRRRSRGGRNRNRNRQNQGQGQTEGRRNQGRQANQGRQSGQGRRKGDGQGQNRGPRGADRPRRPKPKPLTWWQKLLKAVGLYKEPAPKGGAKKRHQSGPKKDEPKENIRIAKPREKRRDDEAVADPGPAPKVNSKRLYLGNLSYEATESDLEELFRGVGSVRRVEIVYNRQTHRSKGYGFIDMLDADEAAKAIEILHDQFFMGRKLNVSSAKSEGPAKPEARAEEFRPAQAVAEPAAKPAENPAPTSGPEPGKPDAEAPSPAPETSGTDAPPAEKPAADDADKPAS
jgi:hypothetical protein